MQYQEWIKAKDQLSPADRQAFEHELQDNARLQAEQAAFDLTNELLGSAAQGLSEKAILQGAQVRPFPYPFLLGSVIATLALVLGIYALMPDFEAPSTPPATELEQPKKTKPQIPADVEEQVVPEERAPIAALEKARPKAVAVKAKTVSPQPANAPAASFAVELDRPVQEGEEVVAEDIIILKPGFHAKAGSRFSAKVENENVLNR